jgi:hypothetical protein
MHIRNAFCHSLITVVAFIVCASAEARAPAGRYNYASTGLTVYDTKTKLTWQRTAPTTAMTAADAKTYCTGVAATLSGTGWRLPTMKELQSLVDFSQPTGPLIDPAPFPATPLSFFWSSTPVAGVPTAVWTVYFSDGGPNTFDVRVTNSVRCVRS